MDAHQNNQFGKVLLIFSMVFVGIFFIYITYFHAHSSPDHIKTIKDQVIQDKQQPAAEAPAATDAKEETAETK
ncbi:MAG: hypothetical protein AB7F59_06430 [Bdellovibrionales bacterium]